MSFSNQSLQHRQGATWKITTLIMLFDFSVSAHLHVVTLTLSNPLC